MENYQRIYSKLKSCRTLYEHDTAWYFKNGKKRKHRKVGGVQVVFSVVEMDV